MVVTIYRGMIMTEAFSEPSAKHQAIEPLVQTLPTPHRELVPAATDGPVSSNAFMAQSVYDDRKKSTTVAYLLWFFLGGWGAHRFYLNRSGSAVAMLLIGLTVVGIVITGPWALIDAFLIPGIRDRRNAQLKRETFAQHGLLVA
jgi:TM2 domain-containing membrane protein YozV